MLNDEELAKMLTIIHFLRNPVGIAGPAQVEQVYRQKLQDVREHRQSERQ